MSRKKETNRTFITHACASTCACDLVHVYKARARARECTARTKNVGIVHLPLGLSTVLTPAHLIDCTESELISPGGREPTHGYLCHSGIDLGDGNLPRRV